MIGSRSVESRGLAGKARKSGLARTLALPRVGIEPCARRSNRGNQGPQTRLCAGRPGRQAIRAVTFDVGGTVVVNFDVAKLNRLLGIEE